MYKAIFWDNDGVLVNTELLFYKANKELFLRFDLNLSLDEFIKFFLVQGIGTWHWLRNKGVSDATIKELKRLRDRRYSELIKTEDITVTGAQQVLTITSRKLSTVIVTSSRRDHFTEIHKKTGFSKYFDRVITGDDCDNTKPNPEPYLKAVNESSLDINECLVIEDSLRGLKAAKAAGLDCWVIPNALTCGSPFDQADKVLGSIIDVVELLGFEN